jgi:drug/metabolite transporter (DMT)-like permease
MMNTFPGADSMSSILLGQAVCAVTQTPFIFAETEFTAPAFAAILVLGVFQLALAYIFMSRGLEHTPAVTASLTAAIEPILNPVLVAIFYGEMISSLSLVGAVIVVVGVIAYNLLKLRTSK